MRHPQYEVVGCESRKEEERRKCCLDVDEIKADPAIDDSDGDEPVRNVNLQKVDEVLAGIGK